MPPLVSILTPSYNQGRFLAQCIESVSRQSHRPIEHIVCDGGSTDQSIAILKDAPNDVTWTSEPDRGQSHALNKAFARSRGEIVGWLNSDDAYVDRRSIAAAVELFARRPDVGVVYGHGLLVNAADRVLQFLWAPASSKPLLSLLVPFVQPAVLIRRSVIQEPFVREELRYVMDYDLWLRLAERTEFHRLDLVVGLDRHQPGRKVLTDAFSRERAEYRRSHGLASTTYRGRAMSKAWKVALRLRATPPALHLPNRLEPAIDLKFDPPLARFARQVMMPRRHMAFE